MKKNKAPSGPTPPAKKPRKQEGEPSLSRLTARQLAVARLVSSYKYECKKVFHALEEQQRRWSLEIDARKQRQQPILDIPHSSNPGSDRARRPDPPPPQKRTPTGVSEVAGEPWKQSEREVLKRVFLSFGFGRWNEIEASVRRLQRTNRHTIGEMESACWELVSKLEHHVEGKEKNYLQQKLVSASGKIPLQSAGAPWAKYHTSARIWARRLQLLDNIRLLKNQMKYSSLRSFFKDSLGAMSDTNPPSVWWCPDADLLLICGAYTYGYGNYDELKSDPDFIQIYKQSCLNLGEPSMSTGDSSRGMFVIGDWPATDLLTKRLKRITDNLIKAQQKNRNKPLMVGMNDEKLTWTKEQRSELLENLMSFGLPHSPQEASHEEVDKDWKKLLQSESLKELSLVQGQALCNEILAEMETILAQRFHESNLTGDNEETIKEVKTDPPDELPSEEQKQDTLTIESCINLRNRLELLKTLKSHIGLLKNLEFVKRLRNWDEGLPKWWLYGIHDLELLNGLLVHGFDSWFTLQSLDNYSFAKCRSLFLKTQKTIAQYCPTLQSSPVEAIERIIAESRVILPCEGDFQMMDLSLEWIHGRLKTIGILMQDFQNLYEPIMKKSSVFRTRHSAKSSLVYRDPSVGRIFPFVVSPLLSILSLGSIEHERASFHSKKFIFPIGFQSKRKLDGKTLLCEVQDGGMGPLFQVSYENDPLFSLKHESLLAVWKNLLSLLPEAKRVLSGEELFGFSYPIVSQLIQNLPNASKCVQRFEEAASETHHIPQRAQPGGISTAGKTGTSETVPDWLSKIRSAVNWSTHQTRPSHAVPYQGVNARPVTIRQSSQQRGVLLVNPSQAMQSLTAPQSFQQNVRPGGYTWAVKPCISIAVKDPSTTQPPSSLPAGVIRPTTRLTNVSAMAFPRTGTTTETQKWNTVFPNTAMNVGDTSLTLPVSSGAAIVVTPSSSQGLPVSSATDPKP